MTYYTLIKRHKYIVPDVRHVSTVKLTHLLWITLL